MPVRKVLKAQTRCPVTGGKVDKKHYVDARGYRVYLCCPGCADKVRKDPLRYFKVLRARGEKPDKLCKACNEVKGSPTCCKL